MNWDLIAGQENLKNQLKKTVEENRVSHAQLFVGKEGYGTLPLVLAYAQEIFKSENPKAESKVSRLNHMDLHFSFPVFTDNKNSQSQRLFTEFRNLILENPYFNLDDWTGFLESDNKQFFISVDEIEHQLEKLSLRSFEGGSKILIIWRADKMNEKAENKFLKFLEEPPEKTYIFLIAEDTNDFLPTILSRAQLVEVPRLSDSDLLDHLQKTQEISEQNRQEILFQAQGNLNSALKILQHDEVSDEFEELFIQWVRDAFQVKKKPVFLKEIIKWANKISLWNREKQKKFLEYCAETFRLALLQSYGNDNLVYKKLSSGGFKWDFFANYIHGNNIQNILEELSTADYHLVRNGNPKIIWTDLGIKLSRYIHQQN